MSFIDNVCSRELAPCEYRLTIYGGECVYVEGVKRVISFCADEILLGAKSCRIRICGQALKIEKFCGEDVAIKGRVVCIERLNP